MPEEKGKGILELGQESPLATTEPKDAVKIARNDWGRGNHTPGFSVLRHGVHYSSQAYSHLLLSMPG